MTIGIPQLRAFVAVADSAGFSAAADRLGLSQSAVSHAVAALERSTGRQVLSRRTPTRPTAFGGLLLAHARAALASLAAIEELASRREDGPHGDLVLAASPTVCHGVVPELLGRWRARFPGVSISLFEGDDDEVADWLAAASADLAVLVDPVDLPAGAVPLAEDCFYALLRRDHPMAGPGPLDVADLADDPFLLSTGGCERHVRQLHQLAGVPFRAVHRVRQLGTLLAMIRAGIGVSVVPGLVGRMVTDDLVLVPLVHQVRRTLVLTGPRERPWHPATVELLASLEREQVA